MENLNFGPATACSSSAHVRLFALSLPTQAFVLHLLLMAPVRWAAKHISHLNRRFLTDIKTQWINPSDLLSLLLILGGDVVQTAIAQLCGGPYYITPVAFSFGWVAYSVSAVLYCLDDGRLMPRPDRLSIVVNVSSGIKRPNHSWILSRILRDWRKVTRDPQMGFLDV
jgi:hypothetical protein